MNVAIIVAAGSGTRFGSKTPKQFLEIAGKPLIIHTLAAFERCPQIGEIILVLPAAEIESFPEIAEKYCLKKTSKIIAGSSAARAESVFNGLKAIYSENVEIVCVHDGARPLVTIEEITKTIEKAQETGAACLVAPVTDTIKKVSGGKIVETADRASLRRALTPQCFRFEILRRAFDENKFGDATTDECALVEKLGVEISIVEGSARNIKITHAEDFAVAEILLKESENSFENPGER